MDVKKRTAHMIHRNNIVPSEPVELRSNRQKYRAEIPCEIIDMAKRGMFPEEWCAQLGVSMRTIYAWANDRPEFEEAVEHAWHLLHAYWARLIRENISNPAFRQNAALRVMAKRFPATWGNEPRNTMENFSDRNENEAAGTENSCGHCASIKNLSEEELKQRVDVLLERRRIDAES